MSSDLIDKVMSGEIQVNQDTFSPPQFTFDATMNLLQKIVANPPKNLMVEQLEEANKKLDNQTSELIKIRYENKMLNAQIKTANITIDKLSDEIDELKKINNELKKSNKIYKENQKHSMRNGIIIGLIPSVIILIVTVILTYFGLL